VIPIENATLFHGYANGWYGTNSMKVTYSRRNWTQLRRLLSHESGHLFHVYLDLLRNSSITGLSKLVDNFSISPTPDYEFLLSYSVQAPEILFRGEHDANLTLTSSGVEILTKGDYSVGFTNAFIGLTLKVKILLENALSITSASLDLSFDELKAHTTEATIAGEPINWDELSEQITVIFPVLWEQAKGNIDMLIRIGLNAVMRVSVKTASI